jgi:hypothetical protein
MANKRIKLGPLDTPGSVASENRWIYRQMKVGYSDPTSQIDLNKLMKMSQVLMNQKGMIESSDIDARLKAFEEEMAELKQSQNRPTSLRVVK